MSPLAYPRRPWLIYSTSPREYQVRRFPSGELVATIALTPWDRWKLVGEDTYAHNVSDLVDRLERRALEQRSAPPPSP